MSVSNSERKQAEKELRRSRDELELRVLERTAELEESNKALQDFASIASHDLQEPLRKVMAFGQRLKEEFGDSLGDRGDDYLGRMLGATERMKTLINSLLDYSRVTTGAAPFREVALSRLIREALSDLEVRIENTKGEVIIEDLPVVSADSTQVRQLFQNLLGNALKFHKKGIRPLIKVRSDAPDDRTVRIFVEDNGIGFEEKYLDKVFAPFQRLHGKSSQYEGAGMGLAICKKIVERHGGSITARSRPGEGAVFILTLPAKRKK